MTLSSSTSIAPSEPRLAIDPRILAIAAFNAIFGLVIAGMIATHVWAVDGDRNLRAALALANGTFGTDRGYLYSPLAAALTWPAAAWLPPIVAVWGWILARAALVAAGVARETRRLTRPDAILVAVATLAFIPTIEDLMLGQVSVLILATVAIVVWRGDGYLEGLPLGLILATVPKPAIIPILVWMLVYRKRALLAALLTAAALTLLGLVLFGPTSYGDWLNVLLHQASVLPLPAGNQALGAVFPPIMAWPLMAVAVAATGVALVRGETPGFIACLCVGLLVAPYTMAYGAILLLLAVRPLAAAARAPAVLLAAIGSLAVVLFLPLWTFAILATTLVVPQAAWTNLHEGAAT
jgi:hypothetical protein